MSLIPAPENSVVDALDIAAGLDARETPLDEYLAAKAGEGFWYSTPGQAAAQMRVPDAMPSDDELEARSRMSGVPVEKIRVNLTRADTPTAPVAQSMDEAAWKGSAFFRPGLSWDAGMTEPRARALADQFDENAYRRSLIEHSPSGVRSLAGFAAQMAGGALDPVNYVPFLGEASQAAIAARAFKALGPLAGRIAAPALVHGAGAAAGAAVAEPFVAASARRFGDDVGLADAALDIGFAAAFGATFGGTTGAWRAWRDRPAVAHDDVPGQAGILSDAVSDVARGRPVDLAQSDLSGVTDRLRAAIHDVDNNPIGDPFRPLVELQSADLEKVIVARGGFEHVNELEVSRAGWGLVKVIWRHGWKSREPAALQVTENDILALPDVIRTKQPIPEDRDGRYRTWVVQRDSVFGPRKIVYGVKTMEGDNARTLVTIHVVDPAGKKSGIPLSQDFAGARSASPGEVSRPPRDTAALSSESDTQGQTGTPAFLNIGDRAVTVTGRSVPVAYELADAADLVASHGPDGERNPAYPADLQPRDRSRAASSEQVARIAADLRPELLGPSPTADVGAPIIGPDGVVESGNGRVLAIRRAYAQGGDGAARYRAYLSELGFDTAGLKEPVLVRRRRGDMDPADRAAFAREANERPTLALSATERAMADAYALDPDLIALHRGGSLASAENRDFVRAFLDRVSPADRAALVDRDGRLSADGLRRLNNAMLAKAYSDGGLVAALAENPDPDIKTIGRVLTDLAPEWALLRAGVADGTLARDMDQTAALLRAVDMIRSARASGEKVRDVADQLDLFDPQSAEVDSFLRLFYGDKLARPVGRDKLAAALGRFVADARMNIRDGLFPARPVADLLDAATGRRSRVLDTTRPADPVPEAKPEPIAPGVEGMAREAGIDPKSGAFDEQAELGQLAAENRLRPEEKAALDEADALAADAETFAAAYDAAAACLARTK